MSSFEETIVGFRSVAHPLCLKFPHTIKPFDKDCSCITKFNHSVAFNEMIDMRSPQSSYTVGKDNKMAPQNTKLSRMYLGYLILKILKTLQNIQKVDIHIIGGTTHHHETLNELFPTREYINIKYYSTSGDQLKYDESVVNIIICDDFGKELDQMQKQVDICRTYKPYMAILKFILPYTEKNISKKYQMFDGQLYPQIFVGSTSTRSWLMTDQFDQLKTYVDRVYEDIMYFHNCNIRIAHFPVKLEKYTCPCFDCSILREFACQYVLLLKSKLSIYLNRKFANEVMFLDKLYDGELERTFIVQFQGRSWVTTLGFPNLIRPGAIIKSKGGVTNLHMESKESFKLNEG